jgi:hypothetical protein
LIVCNAAVRVWWILIVIEIDIGGGLCGRYPPAAHTTLFSSLRAMMAMMMVLQVKVVLVNVDIASGL